MKALVVDSPGKVEVRDVPKPEIQPFEALVKIDACGLCGTTDRHIVEGRQAHHPASWYPAILGHESVGTVIQIGPLVTKFKVGDRVTRPVALWPGTQQDGLYSAWGGFAEYGIVRDSVAAGMAEDYTSLRQHVVPAELSLEEAVLALSLSEVASWMEKLGNLKDKTVVIGGTGFAACTMCQCAKAAGARHIIVFGRSAGKFPTALRNGATDTVIMNDEMESIVIKMTGTKADWFLEASGHQSVFEAGLRLLKPGGSAAIYGAPEGFSYRLPLGIVGGDFSVRYVTPNDDSFFQETCQRIRAGSLSVTHLHTHTWKGLESIGQAFEDQRSGALLKGLIRIADERTR